MMNVLVTVVFLGIVGVAVSGCIGAIVKEITNDAFCVTQGYARAELVLGQDCCVGYRDGELVVVPFSELEAQP
jgi:hypothetical protein